MKPTKESFDDAKEEKRSRNSKKGTMTWLTATQCLYQKIMFVFRLS
jgi:hypothetical protein